MTGLNVAKNRKTVGKDRPQWLLDSDLKNLVWPCSLLIILVVCGVKEYRLSNVRLKIYGLLIVGFLTPSTKMLRFSMHCFARFMNMVVVGLAGESVRLLAVEKRKRS